MKSTAPKLPGKFCRVLSFVPWINWLSVLYIGIVNTNALHIICGIVYAVVTFAIPSTAPFLWIVGIVHYIFAYRSIKKRMNLAETLPVKPQEKANTHFPSPTPTGFSNMVLPGEPEKKQAVPARPQYSAPTVRVSTHDPHEKFFADMKRFAQKDGKAVSLVPFMSYWPTYDSMNKSQQAWYFYWRSQVSQGNYIDTDLSYIFVLIYELLSGTGWETPREGYEKLTRVWNAYRERFPALDRYLADWTFDFAQQYELKDILLSGQENPHAWPSAKTDLTIAQHASEVPLKLSFPIIDALCDYSIVSSKFYKDGNQELMREAIPRVVALADAALQKKTGKGILDTYGPTRAKKQDYYAFASAVCPQANQKMTFTVKGYSASPKLRAYINELVRYGENSLRGLCGCRGRLRGITLDPETSKLIDSFLAKEYGNRQKIDSSNEKPTKVVLNFENINTLREESDAVREALSVEEPEAKAEKALLTDVKEVTSIYLALSPESRGLLDRLQKNAWEVPSQQGDEALIQEINRQSERYLGRALLAVENADIIAEDDYRDELAYIFENPPAMPAEKPKAKHFDSSLLPEEFRDFVEALSPEQGKALLAVIASADPQPELEKIAEEAMTMPQILLDDINAAAMQYLGDILIDTAEESPHVLDEYAPALKKSIA
jgi:hypothetical protein